MKFSALTGFLNLLGRFALPPRARVRWRRRAPVVPPPEVEFEAALREILKTRKSVAAADIQFIGLATVRKRLGRRWPELAEKVMRIATNCVESMLDAGDVFVPYGDRGMVVLFAALGPDEGKEKCHRIATEIIRRLLGEDAVPAAARIGVASSSIEAADLSEARRLRNKGGALSVVRGKTAAAPVVLHEASSATPATAPVAPRRARKPASKSVAEPSKVTSVGMSVAAEKKDAPPPPVKKPRPRRSNAKIGELATFLPLWNVRTKAVSAYDMRVPPLSAFGIHVPEQEEFDHGMVDLVRTKLAELIADNRKSLLVVPVHLESLQKRQFVEEFARVCEAVPPEQKALVVFKLSGAKVGTPQIKLDTAVAYLKRFGRSVAAEVILDGHSMKPYADAGFFAVYGDFKVGARSENEMIAAMNQFALSAEKFGLMAIGIGVGTTSLAVAGVCAGFEFLGGDAVGGIVASPEGAYGYDTGNLFAS